MQKKKMIRNLNKKLGAKFPSTTLGFSVVRISCHDDAFPGILKLEASPVEESKETHGQTRGIINS